MAQVHHNSPKPPNPGRRVRHREREGSNLGPGLIGGLFGRAVGGMLGGAMQQLQNQQEEVSLLGTRLLLRRYVSWHTEGPSCMLSRAAVLQACPVLCSVDYDLQQQRRLAAIRRLQRRCLCTSVVREGNEAAGAPGCACRPRSCGGGHCGRCRRTAA